MPAKAIKTLDVRSRERWRKWLQEHHDSVAEIWLVFHKRHTGRTSISYDDALDEALCFGWIDSLVRRLDDDRYARKFTPRKSDSKWSTINRRRYAELKAQGLIQPPGLARAPTNRSGDAPRPSIVDIPPYIADGLSADARAWKTFEDLAPSYRRMYIAWIDSAKREVTRAKRLRDALALLAAGKRLGLK